ncbi:NADPH2:quinone reductase [Cladophialophora psammophila CBS 110553]|uniref:Probable quinone oxidoreductase n=1 Tax=Cladophialophora psammophila CBS 110553 TaxID=1182543 RepID=W9X1A8_9EURO|nr:NADPH2:quinone reductase [Cladophialophora psammophila CBS 110553]EXJ71105.1 NADPH2:quinone reductase [Cladophialophora psammophila CBS 110553]
MSPSTTMEAVRFHSTGDSSVLQLENNVPIPQIADNEVLIKVEYAGVNFVDTYQRSGLYPIKLPAVAGREGAGTIVEVGREVPLSFHLELGDRVAVFAQGTLAQYVAASAESILKLPSSVSTRVGAAVMLQGLTAWTIVRDAHDVQKGQVILVQAAAGGTGGLIVQMCKHLGATVIGTVSTAQKAEVAKQHGCDHVIIYKERDVLTEVLRLTDGKGCHAVLSGIGQSTFATDLASTRRKGTLVSYGNSSGPVVSFKILELSKKNIKLVRPTLANYIQEREEFVERTKELLDLLSRNIVSVPIEKEYMIDQVGHAQDELTGQKTTGKLVVKIAS